MLNINKEDLLRVQLTKKVTGSNKPITAFRLAISLDESVPYVQRILSSLVTDGLLSVKRGPNGGYTSTRKDLTLGDIIKVKFDSSNNLETFVARSLQDKLNEMSLGLSPTIMKDRMDDQLLELLVPRVSENPITSN